MIAFRSLFRENNTSLNATSTFSMKGKPLSKTQRSALVDFVTSIGNILVHITEDLVKEEVSPWKHVLTLGSMSVPGGAC